MKARILFGLALCAAIGFGIASIYLYVELEAERNDSAVQAKLLLQAEARAKNYEHARFDSLPVQSLLPQAQSNGNVNANAYCKPEEMPSSGTISIAHHNPPPTFNPRANGVQAAYADLLDVLKLNPADSAKLVEMLVDNQSRMVEPQNGAIDAATQSRTKDDLQREGNNRILALLGSEKFREFENYQQNLQEHIAISQLREQLAASGAQSLTKDQEKVLFQAMTEEKGMLIATSSRSDALSPAAITERMESMESYNRNILGRAERILTADQFAQFRDRQQQQVELMRGAMNSFRKQTKSSPSSDK